MSRHIFRMTYFRNIEIFLRDGAVYAKNHQPMQRCYQTSFAQIVNRRGQSFHTPNGDNVNSYVPFYFSPITSMAYTIYRGNVPLVDPTGIELGAANYDGIVFLVSNTNHFLNSANQCWITDIACNTISNPPCFENDLSKLSQHIDWSLFDEAPYTAHIPEIGYRGVRDRFNNIDGNPKYSNRSQKRMAEFMVKDRFSLGLVDCIIVKNDQIRNQILNWMQQYKQSIPVYTKPDCYF